MTFLQRLRQRFSALRFLRLAPYDTATEQGRADERHRRVALTAAASVLAKLLSVSTMLISVPLTLGYLGTERYGMWMTMSSLIAMLGFADLGIGNGVLTAVARAHGQDDRAAIRRYVSSGLFVLTCIAIFIGLLFAACYPFVAWHRIFNVNGALARAEAAPALAVFVACFALAIPTSIVQRVQMGMQRGFMASLWQCAASTLGLAGVLLVIHFQGGLPWLVLAFVGAPLATAALNSLLFFGSLQPDVAPYRAGIVRATMWEVGRTGALFLVLQIVVAVAFASDTIIIAQMMGASAVADYAVPDKMFGVVTMLVAMMVGPLWPAYGEAIARGDKAWVQNTVRRSMVATLAFSTCASAVLVLCGPWLIRLWVGTTVQPTFLLLGAFALWKVVESCGTALAAFLNGAHLIRFQALTAIFTAAAAIALKLWLTPRLGVAGILLATSLAWLVLTGLPMYFYLRQHHYFKAVTGAKQATKEF